MADTSQAPPPPSEVPVVPLREAVVLPMSVGALYGQVKRCAEQLEPIEQQIKTALSHANVLHQPSRAFTIS